MKPMEISLARIGNSRGIRLPSALIRKHGLEGGLVLEDRGHEIVLTPKSGSIKLSWEETAKEMAASGEDWSDWEGTVADGLDQIPWEAAPVIPASKPKKKAKISNGPISEK
jgi:antitoxin MazE